ncbi:MAG: beta-glucosidase [Candidatus Eisenbacteria bacterium]|nr:beta-glucosidase [Candidatus Eisenbacteria bacterium]
MKTFPEGFLWGAATSAYQIEGSPLADGAGSNIWHRFTHSPGRSVNGDTGDVACDHYRRWESDVELMKELGLQSYRFSLAWARILPEGRGRVNQKGLDFYRRLVDRLLERGIKPNITLYHWDLPTALDDRGGWLNPDIDEWFADYAQVAFDAFADRVPMWATLNEPWVAVDGGYLHGVHAPGHANLFEAPIAAHRLLLAHGAAVERYRAGGWKHQIGIVVNLEPKDPASDSPEDVAATSRAHTYFNEQYCDALFLGRYPDGMREIYGDAWPEWPAADLARISAPLDFLGINYYTRALTRFDAGRAPVFDARVSPDHPARMTTGWEFHPEGLTRTLLWVKERYGDMPMYVTENGGAYPDPPTATNGRVDDPLRVECYRQNLLACRSALEQGVDLRGFFAWSLMDNLEWSAGFSQRFGLVHVDFATQQRTIKASGEFYREAIRTHGASLA